MKIIACNDLHFDHLTPRARTDDYQEELLGLLGQIGRLAIHLRADAVVIAGDIFHRWNSWQALMTFYRWLRTVGVPVVGVAGNHDLVHNRLDSLPQTAYGLLTEVGKPHDDHGGFIDVSRKDAFLWDGTSRIRISGVPYPDAKSLDAWVERASRVGSESEDAAIVLGHCFSAPEAGSYWGEPIIGYADLQVLPWDVFVFGHDHHDQGVTKLGEKWFVSLPSLARGVSAEDDITRAVKVAVLDYQPAKPLLQEKAAWVVQQIRLKARPAEEIFDLKERAQQKADRAAITSFVQKLHEDLQAAGPALQLEERIERLSLPADIRTKVFAFLADAEESLR